MKTSSKTYHLTDLATAALLVASGCQLARVEDTSDPKRKAFVVIGDSDIVQGLLIDFRSGSVVVRLDNYLAAERLLKNRLHRFDEPNIR